MPRVSDIVRPAEIESILEATKEKAKDPVRVRDILAKAKERALLRHVRLDECRNEYVQGLSFEEAAILLNIDTANKELLAELLDAAHDIKEQIYGKRIVLFAPLYVCAAAVRAAVPAR